MTTNNTTPSPRALRAAWAKLHEAGTATPAAAHVLRVGIEQFLQEYSSYAFGSEGTGQGFKVVLGANGEGKTHLLLCLKERALAMGHMVALVDAGTAGAGNNWAFAQSVLGRIEVANDGADDLDDPLMRLLRGALEKKRREITVAGLDVLDVLPEWIRGIRNKNLRPHGLADAVADGLQAVLTEDDDRLRTAIARVRFEGVRMTRAAAHTDGAALLRSLPLLSRLLGYYAPVILLDEAETAVEKAGSLRRREFLKFLRFLLDHVASDDAGLSAIVVVACTDDFWPDQFNEYQALRQRVSDPGYDSLEDRVALSPRSLAQKNKLWVRETFRGNQSEYCALGYAIVDFCAQLYPEVDREKQASNVRLLATAASDDSVRKQVKRTFVKALSQTLQSQLSDGRQVVLEKSEAARLLEVALRDIRAGDEQGTD